MFYCDICKATQSSDCWCDDWDEERHQQNIKEIELDITTRNDPFPMTQEEFDIECMLSWPENFPNPLNKD
jgi:hypothetical protein